MNAGADSTDVAIVGGGLAGLAAAALLARGGRRVTLFERAPALGGRAATHERRRFRLNQGPHAFYRTGAAPAVLRDLGVRSRGAMPGTSGAIALTRGARHALPTAVGSLLRTRLFGLGAKLETARLFRFLPTVDPAIVQSETLTAWLQRFVRHPDVRRFVLALVRLSSYANDPDRMSAGAALAQLQRALSGGVLYSDGGWQVLVDGVAAAARRAGATIVTGARVVAVEHDAAVRAVRLADGTVCRCRAVVVAAGGPPAAADLLAGAAGTSLRGHAAAATPV